jgi:thiol-disulfide isomerase/thioredoxin
MGLWDWILLGLFLVTFGVTAYVFYRWWKVKKMLSYTKQMIGLKLDDLVPSSFKGKVPINVPKKGKVVIFFHGPGCKLCPKQEEELKKLAKPIKVIKYDVRTKQGKALAALFRVMVLPTVIVLKNGEIKGYFTAFADVKKILKALKEEKV